MYFILGLFIGLIIGVIIGFGSVSLFRRAIIDSYRDYMNNKGNQFMNNLIKSFAKEFAEAGESTSLVDIAKNAYANAMGVTTGSTNKSEIDDKRERIKRSKRSNRNDNSDDSDDSEDEKSMDPALAAKINSDKSSSILEGSSEKQNNVKPDLDAKSDRVKTLVTEEKVIITD